MTASPPPASTSTSNPKSVSRRFVVWCLVILTLGALIFTLSDYGFAIDEATYIWVARQERQWFEELPERGVWNSLTKEGIAERFHFLEPPRGDASHSNFNLPLSMHLFNVAWLFLHRVTSELTSYRAASMVLFAVCVGDVFRTLTRIVSFRAGLIAAFALIGSPRIFGHAHLAATESPLSSLWMLTCLAMMRLSDCSIGANATWRRAVSLAILLSMTMSVKLTGWLLAPMVFAWLLLVRPRGWRAAIVLCALLPPLMIIALTPNLWHDPIGGLAQYLSTASSNPWQIATYYLGEGYAGRLPASSALVLLATMMPVSLLCLSLLGMGGFFFSSHLWAVAGPTLLLLLARMAGFVPTHDGERQFLPVFYGVAVLSGFGFERLVGWCLDTWLPVGKVRSTLSAGLGVLLLVEPMTDLWAYRGHGLVYYNRAIGGLRGASERGLEISYWFETMSRENWKDLLGELPLGANVFLRPDHPGLEELKRWGVWREDLRSVGPEEADYYLLYAKRAAYFVPDKETGRLVPTDLGWIAEYGPMEKEIRFEGVRLVGLKRAQ